MNINFLFKYRKTSLKKEFFFLAYKYGYKHAMEVVTFTCFFSECTRKLNNEVCFLSVKKCVCEGFWSIWGGVGGGVGVPLV